MWVKQCNVRGKEVSDCSEIHLKWKVLKLNIKVNNTIRIGNSGVLNFLVPIKCAHSEL